MTPRGRALAWLADLQRRRTQASRRYVSGLIRLALAVDAVPRQEGSDAAEALWRAIRGVDCGRAGADAETWCRRLFREWYLPPDPPPPPEPEQQPDQRPGCYYVSAISDGSPDAPYYFVAGPYPTHAAALAQVGAVRAEAERRDPRAYWMAWGTARTEPDDVRTTPLGAWPPPPERSLLAGLAVRR